MRVSEILEYNFAYYYWNEIFNTRIIQKLYCIKQAINNILKVIQNRVKPLCYIVMSVVNSPG
jgi:hypothetical protein